MANAPCAFCGENYIGAALSCYWRWYEDAEDIGFRQQSMPECAGEHLAPVMAHAIDKNGASHAYPESCPACGSNFDHDLAPLYLTAFREKLARTMWYLSAPPAFTSSRPS